MRIRTCLLILAVIFIAGCRNSNFTEDIYRYYTGKRAGYDIWIVDGATIRNSIYPSFLYGGNEQRYPFIPKKEIWVDDAVSCEEFEMTVTHELNERHLMAKFGWTYDKSHDSSLAIEVYMRKKFEMLCQIHESTMPYLPVTDYSDKKEIKDMPDSIKLEKVYRVPIGTKEDLSIWIVDGYLVRKYIYPDFGFSGNDLAYHFIPPKEIWIDGQVSCEETEYSIASEIVEREWMAKGKSYSDAYDAAIDTVQKLRKEQDKLIKMHPVVLIPDSTTRDSGTIDLNEK